MAPLLPEIPDRDAYRAHHPRIEGWLPAAAAVADRHGLPRPGAGDWLAGSDLVFGAGPRAVLKIVCPLYRRQFEAERALLERLAGRRDVGAPGILARGDLEGWPYFVLERLPGVRLGGAWARVPAADREAMAEDLGARMARIHALSASEFERLYDPWPEFLDRQAADAVPRHRAFGLAAAAVAAIPAALAAAGPLPRPGVAPVPIHADLTHDNVHVEEREGRWRISGILDFGDAMLGDPEYDLATPGLFVAGAEPAVFRALLRGAGHERSLEDPAFPARLTAWVLLHRFGTVVPWLPPGATLAAGLGRFWRG